MLHICLHRIYIYILAKHMPSAGFLSPSGGAAPSASRSRGLRCQVDTAFGGGGKTLEKKCMAPMAPHSLETSAGS